MGAQFMYISRFPMRLNHVQARVYVPGAMLGGIVNWKVFPVKFGLSPRLPTVLAGQPPSIEWMTFHTEDLEGCISVVRLIWHEPPP
jgi:hypothetical protein